MRHTAKKWKRRASERLFAPRDYNGYGKAGLNPAEWAYEWSPFSVIIGALSTAQCQARNWHAKIGCDPIVGHCPIQAAAASHPLQPFPRLRRARGLSFRIFRRRFSRFHTADRFAPGGRRVSGRREGAGRPDERNFPTSAVILECSRASAAGAPETRLLSG